MGVRVDVTGNHGVDQALKQLRSLALKQDCEPSGRRLKWYKKRHDHYLKASILRHRRKKSQMRRKQWNWRYPSLDGFSVD